MLCSKDKIRFVSVLWNQNPIHVSLIVPINNTHTHTHTFRITKKQVAIRSNIMKKKKPLDAEEKEESCPRALD